MNTHLSISQMIGLEPTPQKKVLSDSDLDMFEMRLRMDVVSPTSESSQFSTSTAREDINLIQLEDLPKPEEPSPPPKAPKAKVISSVDAPEGGKLCTVRKADGRLQMRIEYNREQVLKCSQSPVCIIPPASIKKMVLEFPEILAPFPIRHGYKS